jgi:ubiquinone/menaquinone biosynthesis C-methylase UbiE
MLFSKPKKFKFIGISFFVYLGAFYCALSLFINDKLKNEMQEIERKGLRKELLHETHNRLANSYEKKTQDFEFRNQIPKYRRILISYAKGKVLELGIGTGKSLEFYKPDCELVAIDYSSNMLKKTEEKLENKDLNNINPELKINLMNMDAEELYLDDNSFDTVVDINNFHTYNDPIRVINNIKRVLKDEGIFLFLARGESDFMPIKIFYRMMKPTIFMKQGQDLTINWDELFENDKNFEIMYKNRKNYGRTYIYIIKLHKNEYKI